MREPQIPLSAVLALIERQESFNTQLIERLGQYLVQAADKYDRALNPPIDDTPSGPMSYSRLPDEAEDLYHQIEAGIIQPSDITGSMRRILSDADMSIDITP